MKSKEEDGRKLTFRANSDPAETVKALLTLNPFILMNQYINTDIRHFHVQGKELLKLGKFTLVSSR